MYNIRYAVRVWRSSRRLQAEGVGNPVRCRTADCGWRSPAEGVGDLGLLAYDLLTVTDLTRKDSKIMVSFCDAVLTECRAL